MSDLVVRRLVRELFRTGLDMEEVLNVVIDELIKVKTPNMLIEHTDARSTITFLRGNLVSPLEREIVEDRPVLDDLDSDVPLT